MALTDDNGDRGDRFGAQTTPHHIDWHGRARGFPIRTHNPHAGRNTVVQALFCDGWFDAVASAENVQRTNLERGYEATRGGYDTCSVVSARAAAVTLQPSHGSDLRPRRDAIHRRFRAQLRPTNGRWSHQLPGRHGP